MVGPKNPFKKTKNLAGTVDVTGEWVDFEYGPETPEFLAIGCPASSINPLLWTFTVDVAGNPTAFWEVAAGFHVEIFHFSEQTQQIYMKGSGGDAKYQMLAIFH